MPHKINLAHVIVLMLTPYTNSCRYFFNLCLYL